MCPGNILNLTEPLLITTSKYYKLHFIRRYTFTDARILKTSIPASHKCLVVAQRPWFKYSILVIWEVFLPIVSKLHEQVAPFLTFHQAFRKTWVSEKIELLEYV